jgi:phage I-like protein
VASNKITGAEWEAIAKAHNLNAVQFSQEMAELLMKLVGAVAQNTGDSVEYLGGGKTNVLMTVEILSDEEAAAKNESIIRQRVERERKLMNKGVKHE